jgi:hypothetical protein
MLNTGIGKQKEQEQRTLHEYGGIEPRTGSGIEQSGDDQTTQDELRLMKSKEIEGCLQKRRRDIPIRRFGVETKSCQCSAQKSDRRYHEGYTQDAGKQRGKKLESGKQMCAIHGCYFILC